MSWTRSSLRSTTTRRTRRARKVVASAMRLLKAMAGPVPAIRVGASAMTCVAGISIADAQMDERAHGGMRDLHRSLVIAEENLSFAMRDRDISRATLVNELLFNLDSATRERKLANNSCLEALQALAGVAVAVRFDLQPASRGADLGS